ncbi:MAG: NADH-quinone oxidoreductase subunit NuoG [Alphaproteobacteria bacterium]
MPKLTIDGIEVEVPAGATVFQACELAGREVPHFCYHPRLNIAGNCRMCLVEVEKAPKPVASCAMPAAEGMVVHTASEKAKRAQKGVLELLLINHPLDCPICDQGGECDLQDLTLFYGPDSSRFAENKRPVADKYMGPLISTHMTRCIHCTRCVRFANEVAGVEEIGATGRGEHMEITTYLEEAVTSELSGNVIDLCPVGALNSKPYEYTARIWELGKHESVDVMDAVGSNIRVDVRGNEVMRILPRLHEDVNEEWISDKTRFVYDGLKKRRLDRPWVKRDGRLQPADWSEAMAAIRTRLDGVAGTKIAAIAGDQADLEAMAALKDLMGALGSPHLDCRQDGAKLAGPRAGWLFNTTIAGIEQADALLLVGAFPRYEAPLVNTRIRKRHRMGGFKIGRIGCPGELTYPTTDVGAGPQSLSDLLTGEHSFADVLERAERPMIIVGPGAVARPDGATVLAKAREVAERFGMVGEGWNGFNVLHTAAARVGGLELGFLPEAGGRDVEGILAGAGTGEIEVVYLLGADEVDTRGLENAFVIYQGSHGDAGARVADVILPGAAYTEKAATWVNLEGRPQRSKLAAFPPGEAKEDWRILRALSEVLGHKLPYDTPAQLRARIAEPAPRLGRLDRIEPAPWAAFGAAGPLHDAPFVSPITDFYRTCPISRASAVMAACVEEIRGRQLKATGSDD